MPVFRKYLELGYVGYDVPCGSIKPHLWKAFGRRSSGEFLTLIGYDLLIEDRVARMKYVSKLYEQQHEYDEAQRKPTFIYSRLMSAIKQFDEPFIKTLIARCLTPKQIKALPKIRIRKEVIDVEKRAQTKLALVFGLPLTHSRH